MSIFESDKDTAKLYVQFLDQNRLQNLTISARMSCFVSEILKPFKKFTVIYCQFSLKTRGENESF